MPSRKFCESWVLAAIGEGHLSGAGAGVLVGALDESLPSPVWQTGRSSSTGTPSKAYDKRT